MNAICRRALGVLVLAMLLGATVPAQAQAIKQLPADPWVVIKFNNPQNISTKFAAMAQKMGLANLDPAFADPLGAMKKQLNIQAGVDEKGEWVLAIYSPAEDEADPRLLVLVPVTDYGAFLKPLPNLKTEGDLSTFTLPDEDSELYAVNRGSYAVIALSKDILSLKPAGIEVGGLAAKQLASNDITAFVNIKTIGAQALPEFKTQRDEIVQGIGQEMADGEPLQQKFAPAIKTLVNQVLNLVEHTLKEGQAATLGLNLVDQGINITSTAEFDPSSYLGQTIASIKNSPDANLLAGLPDRQYFVFAAAVLDPQVTRKILNDVLPPIRKDLENVQEAKSVVSMIDAARNTLEAINNFNTGWVVPAEGEKILMQEVGVYTGDVKKLQEAQRSYFQALVDLMKLVPQGPEIQAQVNPDSKTVGDTKLDQVSLQFKFDTTTPEGAQAAQIISMIYERDNLTGVMGPVNDQTFVAVFGGSDDLINRTVAAAKKQENPLSQRPNIKAVADQLPKSRAVVFYIAVDNIIGEITKFMAQMGMAVPLKLPADMQPIGVAVGTEGAAIRIDAHLSTELLGNLTSLGIQTTLMMQPQAEPKPEAP